jgi:hypothetical protein
VQEASLGPVALILVGKPESCNHRSRPAHPAELLVREKPLKRKRIVRTAEVTIETEEKIVLSATKSRQASFVWCPSCRRQVEFVSPEQAARIADVSPRMIYRWVEANTVHFVENSGHVLVCLSTLFESNEGRDPSRPGIASK